MIDLSHDWQNQKQPACVGVLAVSVSPNSSNSLVLEKASQQLATELQERLGTLDRSDLKALPVYAAYDSFYKRFKKTYHVQLQLESIVFKGKPIRYPNDLVGAMFMAELRTGLLTAAHDLESVDLPLTADIAAGGESYQRINGDPGVLKKGDLFIRDQVGILSSIIYGPDQRTQIKPGTTQALFTTYGPPGISSDQVREELEILEGYLQLADPGLIRDQLNVLQGSDPDMQTN